MSLCVCAALRGITARRERPSPANQLVTMDCFYKGAAVRARPRIRQSAGNASLTSSAPTGPRYRADKNATKALHWRDHVQEDPLLIPPNASPAQKIFIARLPVWAIRV